MRDTVMRLILLADMMTWWNTCHESQYQLKLVWHHMTSWSRLVIKIDERDWADQYWWSHDFASWTWISEMIYKLYEAMWQDWL